MKYELKQDNVQLREELKQDIVDNTTQLVDTIIDTNTHIDKRENNVKPARHEQAAKIEDKLEETLIINKDDSSEIINAREEYKIKSKQSYLIYKNIQFAIYTHSIKRSEELILVKQSEHIICVESTPVSYTHLDVYKRQ